jgi:hypothetical protein
MMPYGRIQPKENTMRVQEKFLLLILFTTAWIGLWIVGPEDPGSVYTNYEKAFFVAVLIGCFIQAVRVWSQFIQQRDAERLKKVLKRRDARPNQ